MAIQSAKKQPSHWFRFVDDTFVVWSHGEDELRLFLEHLNNVHPRIQFTMEMEQDNQLAFLDVLVMRDDNNKLGHKVYRKLTHTDRYLHSESNHHPRQKRGVIKTLVERATRICEPQYLQEELKHLRLTLQNNGYRPKDINRTIRPRTTCNDTANISARPAGTVMLPYLHRVTDRIGKFLRKFNIRTIYRPTRKIQEHLRSAKDPTDPLSSAGVYRIPCSCGSVYIGSTKRSIKTRLTEHQRNCRQLEIEKSAVAEHALSGGQHLIQFSNTQVLDNTSQFSARIAREAIEIYKHGNNFNRKEENMSMSKIWHPLLKNCNTKPLNWEKQVVLASNDQSGSNSEESHARRPHTVIQDHLASDGQSGSSSGKPRPYSQRIKEGTHKQQGTQHLEPARRSERLRSKHR